jgi:hypothetical protein
MPKLSESEIRDRFWMQNDQLSSILETRCKQIEICEQYFAMAMYIVNNCKEGRRLALALTQLETSMLWTLASL